LLAGACVLVACNSEPAAIAELRSPLPKPSGIEWTAFEQRIDGFGAGFASTQSVDVRDVDFLYSTDPGAGEQTLGLSLLRWELDATTVAGWISVGALQTARRAAYRGAKVWLSAVATPPHWKAPGSTDLDASHYAEFTERLGTTMVLLSAQGVPLCAVSPQSDALASGGVPTVSWHGPTLTAFVRDHLGPGLEQLGLSVPVLVPEVRSVDRLQLLGDVLLKDARAARFIGAVAAQSYGATPRAYAAAQAAGKSVWASDVYDEGAADLGMDSALRVARRIHQDLTQARVNAWHYRWLAGGWSNNGALVANSWRTKRAFALGHYSRFVRPGWVRLSVNTDLGGSAGLSAYREPEGSRMVAVAFNAGSSPVSARVPLNGFNVARFERWSTTEQRNLEADTPVAAGQELPIELPPRSIVTWVGTADEELPGSGGTGGVVTGTGGAGTGGIGGTGTGGTGSGGSGGALGSPGSSSGGAGAHSSGGTGSTPPSGGQPSTSTPDESTGGNSDSPLGEGGSAGASQWNDAKTASRSSEADPECAASPSSRARRPASFLLGLALVGWLTRRQRRRVAADSRSSQRLT
jgi:glucuronoarabinoxylan endo-1,4-beta-xylanase